MFSTQEGKLCCSDLDSSGTIGHKVLCKSIITTIVNILVTMGVRRQLKNKGAHELQIPYPSFVNLQLTTTYGVISRFSNIPSAPCISARRLICCSEEKLGREVSTRQRSRAYAVIVNQETDPFRTTQGKVKVK